MKFPDRFWAIGPTEAYHLWVSAQEINFIVNKIANYVESFKDGGYIPLQSMAGAIKANFEIRSYIEKPSLCPRIETGTAWYKQEEVDAMVKEAVETALELDKKRRGEL